ncbi:MAG: PleD family two-component system response regulator [Leptolyngbya sp. BL-A-14]
MPAINGLELCQIVRHDHRWSHVPILFVSTYRDREMMQQAFAAGTDDYILKPIDGSELVTRICNRLKRLLPRPVKIPRQELPLFSDPPQ